MITTLTLLSLISLLICTILAIIIYFKHVRYVFSNKISKLFVFLCLSFVLFWALIEFGYRSASDFNTALFWLKINVAWYFVMSFLLHFTLLYTEHNDFLKRKISYLLIYGPAFFFFLIDINTQFLLSIPIKESWGWTYGIPTNPIIYSISVTWAAFISLYCLYILLSYFFKKNNFICKKQTGFIVIGIFIPFIIGFNTEWLFPILGIKFPELLVPSLTVGLILIFYGIWVYPPNKNNNRYIYIKNEVDKIT